MTDGDTANLAIGQGVLLATPLQVAHAMSGIANGGALPELRLLSQIQDLHGRVVEAPAPAKRNDLSLSAKAVSAVRQGMDDVVNASYGTGKGGALAFTELAGKTGTAQWGPPSKEQRLAWFAGFFPVENPRYAFAVLYEGKPGQSVSGGRLAAPIVRDVFDSQNYNNTVTTDGNPNTDFFSRRKFSWSTRVFSFNLRYFFRQGER
jgi:penicillin-binding protein 2